LLLDQANHQATKADIQDLDAKLVKRVNRQEKRIDALEKEAGLPNPTKTNPHYKKKKLLCELFFLLPISDERCELFA